MGHPLLPTQERLTLAFTLGHEPVESLKVERLKAEWRRFEPVYRHVIIGSALARSPWNSVWLRYHFSSWIYLLIPYTPCLGQGHGKKGISMLFSICSFPGEHSSTEKHPSQALRSRNIVAILKHLLLIACGDGKQIDNDGRAIIEKAG